MGFFKDIFRTIFCRTKKEKNQNQTEPSSESFENINFPNLNSDELSMEKTILHEDNVKYYDSKYVSEKQHDSSTNSNIETPESSVVIELSNIEKDKNDFTNACLDTDLPLDSNHPYYICSPDVLKQQKEEDKKEINEKEKEVEVKNKNMQSARNIISNKKYDELVNYLKTYGSIDAFTFRQKFKAKSVQNFVWALRKDGYVIKTEKIRLHNESGEITIVTNYRLISDKM